MNAYVDYDGLSVIIERIKTKIVYSALEFDLSLSGDSDIWNTGRLPDVSESSDMTFNLDAVSKLFEYALSYLNRGFEFGSTETSLDITF